ncbi:hypothetical protein [Vibrio phage RYC]|nr:hypothetical protein [Vibrio phage RYC]
MEYNKEFNPEPAYEFAVGVSVKPRPECVQGNGVGFGIIVAIEPIPENHRKFYTEEDGEDFVNYIVVTDFGNEMKLCKREIVSMYTPYFKRNIAAYFNQQKELLERNINKYT